MQSDQSQSLSIADYRGDINLQDSCIPLDDADLDYSSDQNSISFQIEEDRLKAEENLALAMQNEPKRKKIFQRTRLKKQPEPIFEPTEKYQSSILKIFDQVFNLGGTPKTTVYSTAKEASNTNTESRPSSDKRLRTSSEEKNDGGKTFLKKNRIFEVKNTQCSHIEQEIEPLNSKLVKQIEQRLVLQLPKVQQVQPKQSSPPMLIKVDSLQDFENLSQIHPKNNLSEERDSIQLSKLLEAQVFNLQSPKKQKILAYLDKPQVQQNQVLQSPDPKKSSQPKVSPRGDIKSPLAKLRAAMKAQIEPLSLKHIKQSPPDKKSPRQQSRIPSLNVIKAPSIEDTRNNILTDIKKSTSNESRVNPLVFLGKKDQMDATNGSIMVQNYQDATKLFFDRHIYQPVSAGQSGNQWEDYRSIESSRVNTTMVVQKFSHTYEQESTLPIFMRNLAKLNGVYPNFSHSGRPTAQQLQQQFQKLRNQFLTAIQFLHYISNQVSQISNNRHAFNQRAANSMTVQLFITSKWQTINTIPRLNELQIHEPFMPGKWDYQKIKQILTHYQSVFNFYAKLQVDPGYSHDIKQYFNIRNKLWLIERNMYRIAKDIYSEALNCEFPKHYYIFLEFLKQQFPKSLHSVHSNRLRELQTEYYRLRLSQDDLILSPVGKRIKDKLESYMKYLHPN